MDFITERQYDTASHLLNEDEGGYLGLSVSEASALQTILSSYVAQRACEDHVTETLYEVERKYHKMRKRSKELV